MSGNLDGMLYRSYGPASPLSDFIEDVWLYDDYTPTHLRERILPSGTIELVINLRDDELRTYDRVRPGVCERFSGVIVSGTYSRFFVIDTAEEASLLGVPDWSQLALDCGFYDQSHIRRFRRLLRVSARQRFRYHQQTLEQRGVHLKRYHLPLTE
jgi:hypothetical protein